MHNTYMKNDITQGAESLSALFGYLEDTAGKELNPERLAVFAEAALLAEVWATPKPGLVDLANCGAHKDMDAKMFAASAASLVPCFERCAEAGGALREIPGAMVAALRSAGLEGERSMYAATGGVNTHKGAVFSMGILCAAAAMNPGSMAELQADCRMIAEALLEGEDSSRTESHGLSVRESLGTGGIRAEALSGFETAFSTGLPALEEAFGMGADYDRALVYSLLKIITETQDSNLAYRGGMEGAAFAQKEAARLTAGGPMAMDMEAVAAADEEFIKRNLSPGGSADLLAFSVMLWFLRKEAEYD